VTAILQYINGLYIPRRRHSALEGKSPLAFERQVAKTSIPYVLKQFIDLVTQLGWSFGFDPATGYTGLMTGRQAVVVHASGVWFDGIGANFGSDFSTPYLQDWLTFIGIENVEHLRIQPTVLNGNLGATQTAARSRAARLATAVQNLK
jgi:FMN-dependent NADH-azoreductase